MGDPDSFEAVLAEEMETMRESFEQKLASLHQQLERESVGSIPNPCTENQNLKTPLGELNHRPCTLDTLSPLDPAL